MGTGGKKHMALTMKDIEDAFKSDAVSRWIVIGNQNPVWEILDLQLEQQPVVDDTVTDVVFD